MIAAVAICYLPYISVGWGVLGFLPGGYLGEEGFLSGDGFWLLSLWRLGFGTTRYDVACYLALAGALLLVLALRSAFCRTRTVAATLLNVNTLVTRAAVAVVARLSMVFFDDCSVRGFFRKRPDLGGVYWSLVADQ